MILAAPCSRAGILHDQLLSILKVPKVIQAAIVAKKTEIQRDVEKRREEEKRTSASNREKLCDENDLAHLPIPTLSCRERSWEFAGRDKPTRG